MRVRDGHVAQETLAKTRSLNWCWFGKRESREGNKVLSQSLVGMVSLLPSYLISPQHRRHHGGRSGVWVRLGAEVPIAPTPYSLILAGRLRSGPSLRGVVLKHFGVLQHLPDQGGHWAWDLHF